MQPINNPEAQAAIVTALRRLVAADNTNYLRDTMRYAGLFDDARAALALLDGTPIPVPHRGRDPFLHALQQILEATREVGDDASWSVQGLTLITIERLASEALDPANW